MNKFPSTSPYIESIWIELGRAERCILRMQKANNFENYEDAWVQFCESIIRCRYKINNLYSHKKNETSLKGKIDNISSKIKKDPWLNYILHARNAETHSIQEITSRKNSSFSISSKGVTHIKSIHLSETGMNVEYSGTKPEIELLPNRLELLPVLDDGKLYTPPFKDCFAETGKPLHEKSFEALNFFYKSAKFIIAEYFSEGTIQLEFNITGLPLQEKEELINLSKEK